MLTISRPSIALAGALMAGALAGCLAEPPPEWAGPPPGADSARAYAHETGRAVVLEVELDRSAEVGYGEVRRLRYPGGGSVWLSPCGLDAVGYARCVDRGGGLWDLEVEDAQWRHLGDE